MEAATNGWVIEVGGIAGNVDRGAILTAVGSPPDVMTDCCKVRIGNRAGIPNDRP